MVSKKIVQKENKQLKNILLISGLCIVVFIAVFFYIGEAKIHSYHGIKFQKIKVRNLTFYKTIIHLHNKYGVNFENFHLYIRTNPKQLEKIPSNATIEIRKNFALGFEEDFKCSGKGVLAVGELLQLLRVMLKSSLIENQNISQCSESYTFIYFKNGNSTKIEQIGDSCYNIVISNCEILEVTEKFMLDTFERKIDKNSNSLILYN